MFKIEKEITGLRSYLDGLIEKKNFFQDTLLLAYDDERKFTLMKSVEALEKEIIEVRVRINNMGASAPTVPVKVYKSLFRPLYRVLPILDLIKPWFRQLENKLRGYDRKSLIDSFSDYINVGFEYDPNLLYRLATKINPNKIVATRDRLQKNVLHLFLDGFLRKNECFVLLLADVGAGKTLLMQKLFHDFALTYPQERLAFVYAGENTFDRIRAIPSKNRTALFLDAIDEDTVARVEVYPNAYWSRYAGLLTEFKRVIVSCRTQFFKRKEDEWKHLKGRLDFEIVELNLFSENEAKQYLNNKYRKNLYSRERALLIYNKKPQLFSRPLVLSWMDDLLLSNREYDFHFEIYEEVTLQWANREAGIVEQDVAVMRTYPYRLLSFSKGLAGWLYRETRRDAQPESISELATKFELTSRDARSRSFVTRNRATDRFAFCHESLLDYFLARTLFDPDPMMQREEDFAFDNWPLATHFFEEMCFCRLAYMKKLPAYRLGDDAAIKRIYGAKMLIPNRAVRAMLIGQASKLPNTIYWHKLIASISLCYPEEQQLHYIFQEYRIFEEILTKQTSIQQETYSYLPQFFCEYSYEKLENSFRYHTDDETELCLVAPRDTNTADFAAMLDMLLRQNAAFLERFEQFWHFSLGNMSPSYMRLISLMSKSTHWVALPNNRIAAITSDLVDQLRRLPELRILDLRDNPMTLISNKAAIKSLLFLPELRSLYLPESALSQDISLACYNGDCLRPLREWAMFPPDMAKIPAGTFMMGQPDSKILLFSNESKQVYSDDEQPVHSVTLNAFELGVNAVTLGEFRAFMEDPENGYLTDAELNKDGSRLWHVNKKGWEDHSGINWRHDVRGEIQDNELHPVLHVSWYDAVCYCNWLSNKTGRKPYYHIYKDEKDVGNLCDPNYDTNRWQVTPDLMSKGFRLPTEAEWEYAAREGGHEGLFFGTGKNKADPIEMNFNPDDIFRSCPGVYRKQTTPVGLFDSNSLGLHDMSGNVFEWCWDWHLRDYYDQSSKNNPAGPEKGSERIMRGGSWLRYAKNCRTTDRYHARPFGRYNDVGFRLARTL